LKRILKWLFISLALIIAAYIFWLFTLDRQIQNRLKNGWFLPPVEIYSNAEKLWPGKNINSARLVSSLKNQDFEEVASTQKLHPQEFRVLTPSECLEKVIDEADNELDVCVEYQMTHSRKKQTLIAFKQNSISGIYSGRNFEPQKQTRLKPLLFAQFYGEKPLQKQIIDLSEVPLQCLQAVTAIEDSRFLDHRGISFIGILRAALKNIMNFKMREGASTITQQLIKNYFLTPEKTLSRKIKEASMALVVELRFSKDQILESYLNVIYMGQNSTFQVRGYGAASKHYFGKSISKLNLNECSLLAAIINSPGLYNPFTRPESAIKRRRRVLTKMLENNI